MSDEDDSEDERSNGASDADYEVGDTDSSSDE